MKARSAGGVSWAPAPPEHFTGEVWFGPMVRSGSEMGLEILGVRFAPRSRTDWHAHTEGQILYIVSGSALVGTRSGELARLGPGSSVYAPPGEEHWHGAGGEEMVHLSITRGDPTVWLDEKVGDPEYPG